MVILVLSMIPDFLKFQDLFARFDRVAVLNLFMTRTRFDFFFILYLFASINFFATSHLFAILGRFGILELFTILDLFASLDRFTTSRSFIFTQFQRL